MTTKIKLRPGNLGKVYGGRKCMADYARASLEDQRHENEHLMQNIRDFYRTRGQPEPMLWQEEVTSGKVARMTIRSKIAPGTRV